MLVSRLEVFGFKSFLEKLSLPLSGGLTAVVGPNGCGKSNIVDALRWILGETKASSLRGGSLEDVIFNGTETLRPLGLAEVSITIKSEQGSLYDEIIAQQKSIWESSSGLPLADQQILAGAEVLEELEQGTSAEEAPLEATGSASPRFSVIQGGKLSADNGAIEPKGEVSATIVQDSCSTGTQLAFHSSPEVLGDDSVPESLRRFSWLAGVSEVQVTRRLYRSGESEFFLNKVACRLRDLKELFRIVGVAARGYTVVAQGEVTRLITAKPQERRLILEEAAGIAGFREKRCAAERRLEETGISISRLDDIIKEVARQVNSLKVYAARAVNRAQLKIDLENAELKLLLDAEARIGETVAKAKLRDNELRSREGELALSVTSMGEEEERLRNKDQAIEKDVTSVRGTLETAQTILSGYIKNRSQLESRKASVDSALASMGREEKRTAERLSELQTRLNDSLQEFGQLQAREQELRKELAQLNSFDANELRNAEIRLRESRQELQKKELELRQCREKLVAEESRKRALDEQFEALHPRSSLHEIRNKLSTIEKEHSWVARLRELLAAEKLPIVAEIFSFESRYADALSAILGDKAEALLSSSPHELCGLYAKLNETRLAKECSSLRALSLQAHSAMTSEAVTDVAGADRADAGSGPEDTGTEAILQQSTQQVSDALSEISSRSKLQGKNLLSMLKVLPEYAEVAERLLGNVYFSETYEDARQMLEECEPFEIIVTKSGEVLSSQGVEVRREAKNIVAVKGELENLSERCISAKETVEGATAQRRLAQQLVQQAEEAHGTALKASQERQRKARELSSEHGVLLGKLHIEQRMRGQVEADLRSGEQQVKAFGDQRLLRSQELETINSELAALSSQDESELEAQVLSAKESLKVHESEAAASRNELREKSKELQLARSQLDQVRRDLSEASLSLQRVSLELEARREQFVREYPETAISEEKTALEDSEIELLKAEAQKLRARLIREGDVDPTAPERLAVEQARLAELEMQRTDLENAAQALRDTIAELAGTSRERFEKLFVSVARNFSELVAKLFGGGAGELSLTDPSNPLESGIELYVRPPGKKPKSIDLLSGGEKTLCALALMIALFLERPSPLCVLDEVDAPLDEANLQRFVGLVKEMSAKTQFVMVTHNKQTMSVADRLIGVTMPQAGASKVLAVSLDEAYQAVA